MKNILVLHGPNLNMLGKREPGIYGHTSLSEINSKLEALVMQQAGSFSCFQSNAESALIERIHTAFTDGTEFIVINPAAFTHTSVAIRDALAAVSIPFIEVHLSNVHAREPFRHHSYLSDLAVGVVCGLDVAGYEFAVQFALHYRKL